MGHSLRTDLIAMELAARLDMPMQVRRDLYYAALLKDAGCSSNAAAVFEMFGSDDIAAKRARPRRDWMNDVHAAIYAFENAPAEASWFDRARRVATLARQGPRAAGRLVELRCERSAEIVLQLGLGRGVAEGVRTVEEHWDGSGHPRGLRGEEIPIVARLLAVAQALEVYTVENDAWSALARVQRRAGRWFDANIVEACRGLEPLLAHWATFGTRELRDEVALVEPGHASLLAGTATLQRVAHVFAGIVDAKSPFTGAHSHRVANLSVDIARTLGWTPERIEEVRSAALLHDLGKLSVPNSILDKPGKLDPTEWEIMRMHALYTERILEHVPGFEWLAFATGAHHERLDGTGYCRGLSGDAVPDLARILAVADVYDALSAERPYRGALSPDAVFAIMEGPGVQGYDPACLEALRVSAGRSTQRPEEPGRAA